MRIRSANCSSAAGRRDPGASTVISSPPQRATTSDGRRPSVRRAHDLDERLVPDGVAEAVVDRLEAVEVDDEQPGRQGAADDACVLGGHRLLEGTAVRRAGELVAPRIRLLRLRGPRSSSSRRLCAIVSIARPAAQRRRGQRLAGHRGVQQHGQERRHDHGLEEVDREAASEDRRGAGACRRSSMISDAADRVHGDRGGQRDGRHRDHAVRRRSRPARPTMPAAKPWSDPSPPSAKRRRHTGLVLEHLPPRRRRRPPAGRRGARRARSSGVEAVYQLRGPSWTEMRSANTGGDDERRAASGSERSGRCGQGTPRPRRAASASSGKPDRDDRAARVDRQHRSTVEEARRAARPPDAAARSPTSSQSMLREAADIPRTSDSPALRYAAAARQRDRAREATRSC